MKLELENKVVLITGATGAIGRQIVKDFLAEGASVTCLIRDQAKAEALKAEVVGEGISTAMLWFEPCDLLDYASICGAVSATLQNQKKIDVLVNCAGVTSEQPFALMADDEISSIIDVNMKSPMWVSQAVLKGMFAQNSGCIINISSASTVKKGRGIVAYASAKAGLETFTRALAQEVGRKNIRVNCIRPGIIETGMSSAVIFRNSDFIKNQTSLGRVGLPKEISSAVLFVASAKTASYLTGECITIDGGMY